MQTTSIRKPAAGTLLTAVRILLIGQGVGGAVALMALSLLLLLEVVFGAFTIALDVGVAWIALLAAIVVTIVGQQRIGRGDRRWWWAIMGLQAVVVLTGIAILAFIQFESRSGVPAPPPLNVALALALPSLAVVNLALLVGIRASTRVSISQP
jgi:hypothetical protein